MKQTLPNRN